MWSCASRCSTLRTTERLTPKISQSCDFRQLGAGREPLLHHALEDRAIERRLDALAGRAGRGRRQRRAGRGRPRRRAPAHANASGRSAASASMWAQMRAGRREPDLAAIAQRRQVGQAPAAGGAAGRAGRRCRDAAPGPSPAAGAATARASRRRCRSPSARSPSRPSAARRSSGCRSAPADTAPTRAARRRGCAWRTGWSSWHQLRRVAVAGLGQQVGRAPALRDPGRQPARGAAPLCGDPVAAALEQRALVGLAQTALALGVGVAVADESRRRAPRRHRPARGSGRTARC